MRPPREDIAAPELPRQIAWVNSRPPPMSSLVAAGPALVHFFDFAQLNSVRALPYLIAWNRRYAEAGLTVVGVHSPRFPFTADAAALAAASERLGVAHPLADDSAHALWRAYGVEGWPSLFLWGRGGALRWFHFGEGEYEATERAIQDELRIAGFADPLPEPLEPLRPSDAPGALVAPPTEEVFPGGGPDEPWSGADGRPLELQYGAGGAHASADGNGELLVAVDGGAGRRIRISAPGLYRLSEHPHHESHRLRVATSGAARIWSLSFEAAPRAGA